MIRIEPLYAPQIEQLIEDYFRKLDQQLGCKKTIDPELAKRFADALERAEKERKNG